MTDLHTFPNGDDLVGGVARALLDRILALQADGGVAQVCLTGGPLADQVYAGLGALVEGSGFDPGRLELWWSDEHFVTTDDADRNAGRALALLAGQFPLDPARTHPMPAADGVADNAASAATYAKELGDTRFDICLLTVGDDGHVASIFPEHPSFEPTSYRVIPVNDAPVPPAQRLSLSVETMSESDEVWLLASGPQLAAILARAVSGDPALPAGAVRGSRRTLWFADADASDRLRRYDCTF